jgi:hypothetical protein
MTRLRRIWPLLAAGALLVLMVWNLGELVVELTGQFVYALDDPYIHMAMARNLAEHGVWGVTRHGFTSSSSSPLWTLLLAADYALQGANEAAPLWLNLLAALGLLALAWRVLEVAGLRPGESLLVLAAVVLLTPLPSLVLIGMEHTLHALLSLAFLACLSGLVLRRWQVPALAICGALLAVSRYEGAFLALVGCGVLVLQRRPRAALAVAASAFAPLVLFGVLSLAKGWNFVPNSVLLKSLGESGTLQAQLAHFVTKGFQGLSSSAHLLLLLLLALGLLLLLQHADRLPREGERDWSASSLVGAYACCILPHLQLARSGSLSRYEAYLVACGVVVLAAVLARLRERWGPMLSQLRSSALVVAMAAVVLLPLGARGASILLQTAQASRNIHEQQHQMALFLARYYPGGSVALNDIGWPSWAVDMHLLDLWGLASMEVATARRANRYGPEELHRLVDAHGVQVVIVYEHWFRGRIPPQWTKVAQWTLPNNVAVGGPTVSFFAPRPEQAEVLERQVREFSSELPQGVRAAFRPRSARGTAPPEPRARPEAEQDTEDSSGP